MEYKRYLIIVKFEKQIKAITEAGYNGISMKQLVDYTEKGIELPEKPIVITFDDGYSSNYEIAYPILKKYNMKATMFIIGSSVDKYMYKDTDNLMNPHFGYKAAKEMVDSGLIEIQSHSNDMHQWQPFEEGVARTSLTRLENETEDAFVKAIKNDITRSKEDIQRETGKHVFAVDGKASGKELIELISGTK